MRKKTLPTSYRFSESEKAKVNELARRLGVNRTRAVLMAVDAMLALSNAKRPRKKVHHETN